MSKELNQKNKRQENHFFEKSMVVPDAFAYCHISMCAFARYADISQNTLNKSWESILPFFLKLPQSEWDVCVKRSLTNEEC